MAKNEKRYKLKPSQKLAWGAMGFGAAVAGGLYLLWPGMYWWVYVAVALVVFSAAFKIWLEMASQQRIIDDD